MNSTRVPHVQEQDQAKGEFRFARRERRSDNENQNACVLDYQKHQGMVVLALFLSEHLEQLSCLAIINIIFLIQKIYA